MPPTMGWEQILPHSLWEGNPATGTVGIEQANGASVDGGGFLQVARWEPLTDSPNKLTVREHPCRRKQWPVSPN